MNCVEHLEPPELSASELRHWIFGILKGMHKSRQKFRVEKIQNLVKDKCYKSILPMDILCIYSLKTKIELSRLNKRYLSIVYFIFIFPWSDLCVQHFWLIFDIKRNNDMQFISNYNNTYLHIF